MSSSALTDDSVTFHIIYPWRQTLVFPSFPTNQDFFAAIGETSEEWCTVRMKTDVLSFNIVDGPLAGGYDSLEHIKVRAMFTYDPDNTGTKMINLQLVSKLASPNKIYDSDTSALRNAAKGLTDQVVADTKFVDKPEVPDVEHPSSDSDILKLCEKIREERDVAKTAATVSGEAKAWSITVTTDRLFSPSEVTLHFPQFPSALNLFGALRRATGSPLSLGLETWDGRIIFEVDKGPFKGSYRSFDGIRVSIPLRTLIGTDVCLKKVHFENHGTTIGTPRMLSVHISKPALQPDTKDLLSRLRARALSDTESTLSLPSDINDSDSAVSSSDKGGNSSVESAVDINNHDIFDDVWAVSSTDMGLPASPIKNDLSRKLSDALKKPLPKPGAPWEITVNCDNPSHRCDRATVSFERFPQSSGELLSAVLGDPRGKGFYNHFYCKPFDGLAFQVASGPLKGVYPEFDDLRDKVLHIYPQSHCTSMSLMLYLTPPIAPVNKLDPSSLAETLKALDLRALIGTPSQTKDTPPALPPKPEGWTPLYPAVAPFACVERDCESQWPKQARSESLIPFVPTLAERRSAFGFGEWDKTRNTADTMREAHRATGHDVIYRSSRPIIPRKDEPLLPRTQPEINDLLGHAGARASPAKPPMPTDKSDVRKSCGFRLARKAALPIPRADGSSFESVHSDLTLQSPLGDKFLSGRLRGAGQPAVQDPRPDWPPTADHKYTFYLRNRCATSVETLTKHSHGLPSLLDIHTWIFERWNIKAEDVSIRASGVTGQETSIEQWLEYEGRGKGKAISGPSALISIYRKATFLGRHPGTPQIEQSVPCPDPPGYTEDVQPDAPRRRLQLVNPASSPYRADREVAQLPDLADLRLIAAGIFTRKAASPDVHDYLVLKGDREIKYEDWRDIEIAQGRLRGEGPEVTIQMRQIDRHAAQNATAERAKSSGSYGISDEEEPSSGSTTPTSTGTSADSVASESRPSAPNSSAYLESLISVGNNTTASVRILRILKDEAVGLDTSLGLKLLDLSAALRTDGELGTADSIRQQDGARKQDFQPIENRLNDFAGMLNVIAEAVGVKLLEDDDDESCTTSSKTPEPETSASTIIPSIADLNIRKDQVAEAVKDLPSSPVGKIHAQRAMSVSQLSDILQSASQLEPTADKRVSSASEPAYDPSAYDPIGWALPACRQDKVPERAGGIEQDSSAFTSIPGHRPLPVFDPTPQQYATPWGRAMRDRQAACAMPVSNVPNYVPGGSYFGASASSNGPSSTTSAFARYALPHDRNGYLSGSNTSPYDAYRPYDPYSQDLNPLRGYPGEFPYLSKLESIRMSDWQRHQQMPVPGSYHYRPMPIPTPTQAFGLPADRHSYDFGRANNEAYQTFRSAWEPRK